MAATWTVLSQRQSSKLTEQGTFNEVMEVTFQIYETGGTYVVEIPSRLYTADYARERIDEMVGKILEVQNL